MSELLARQSGTQEADQLNQARSRLIKPGARTLRATSARGTSAVLQLAPEEWRNVSQVGLVLDDEAVAPREAIGLEEARDAFRTFLRRPQHLPDFDGVARGFIFEREVAPLILARVESGLTSLGSVHDVAGTASGEAQAYRSSRLPILLTGPPACGKSRLLHWLAYNLRVKGHVILYVLTPAGRIHFESVERACRILEAKGAPI
ncbi:MAG: ATP-binding protein [Actinobacteria bacterium]|nr:ATP-binding protein [Actinomycetota bacterium]